MTRELKSTRVALTAVLLMGLVACGSSPAAAPPPSSSSTMASPTSSGSASSTASSQASPTDGPSLSVRSSSAATSSMSSSSMSSSSTSPSSPSSAASSSGSSEGSGGSAAGGAPAPSGSVIVAGAGADLPDAVGSWTKAAGSSGPGTIYSDGGSTVIVGFLSGSDFDGMVTSIDGSRTEVAAGSCGSAMSETNLTCYLKAADGVVNISADSGDTPLPDLVAFAETLTTTLGVS